MRKIFAFTLVVLMVLSVFVLAGCDKKEDTSTANVNSHLENFESNVAEDSKIIGEWAVASPDEAQVYWTFFKNTNVHITEDRNGVSTSDVGAYNYNDETGELSYYVYQTGESFNCKATIEGSKMTIVYEDGTTICLEKRILN